MTQRERKRATARVGMPEVNLRPPKVPEERHPAVRLRVLSVRLGADERKRAVARVVSAGVKSGACEMRGRAAARWLATGFSSALLGAGKLRSSGLLHGRARKCVGRLASAAWARRDALRSRCWLRTPILTGLANCSSTNMTPK